MEAFRWAPHSPRRGRAPAPTALVPGAHYASGPGPAHPPPFSSWHDYLGLATLVTRAVRGERRFGGSGGPGGGGGAPPSSSSSPCCSPHAGPGPGALGPPDYDEDEDEDDGDGGGDEPGAALELRALELCAGPAEAGLPGGRRAELSPFAGRAAAVLLGCAPAATATATGTGTATGELAPREERAPAWAAEPPLHGAASGAARGLRPELQVCVFCRNNREAVALYTTHTLKGPDGRVLCPVLRRYTCPLCGASGDHAHTIKYCPLSKAPPPPRSARDGPQGKKLR